MAGSISSDFADDGDGSVSDINVTPLVDVTLVLLIVFMITVPAIVGSAPITVDLPESGSVAMADELPPLTVSVKRDGDKLAIYLNERPTDEAGLPALIKELGATPKDQAVTLSADRTLPHGDVIRVMDVLHEAGLEKISIDTRHVELR